MQKTQYLKGFTLVELIVVITILAILGTISFISLIGFNKSAREAVRISDLNTIAKSLEFFQTQNGYYPAPSDSFVVSYSGSLAWNQGVFGEDTRVISRRISEVPTDPLTGNEYAYSTTNTKQEYELGAISESILSNNSNLITSQANAASNYYTNIKGNYNKQIVTVKEATRIYILGVPTLITSEINDVTVQEIIANGTFAFKNSQNLPGSYSGQLNEDQTISDSTTTFIAGPVVDTSIPVIYEGTISELSSQEERQQLADNLVSYYQGSNLTEVNLPGLDILLDTDTSDPAEALSYVNELIQTDVGGLPGDDIDVSVAASFACTDMSPSQLSELNDWISIDPVTGNAVAGTSNLTVSQWCSLTSIFTTGKQYLTYVPAAIGVLIDLTSLDLRNNSLTDLPDELENLQKLTWFNLFKNQFITLPAVVFTLKNVETLAVNHNAILSIPPEIKNITGLQSLYLTSMSSRSATPELVEFPPAEIAELPNLINLYVARIFADTIPSYIAGMTNLQAFHIYSNDLNVLSVEVCAFITGQGWPTPSVETDYALGYRDAGQSTGVTDLCVEEA